MRLSKCSMSELSLSWDRLKELTNDFSDENFIDIMQFGKVYRGRTQEGKDLTVKILGEDLGRCGCYHYDMVKLVQQELAFLERQDNHHFAKPIGYCDDASNGRLAVVYHLKPLNTLHILLKDDILDWHKRMSVALKFASLLEIMHSEKNKCYVYNIDPAHIMLDEDLNPFLIDFSAMKVPGRTIKFVHRHGSDGYADHGVSPGEYEDDKADLFAFTVVLISLISKRIWDMEVEYDIEPEDRQPLLYDWAISEYERQEGSEFPSFSLVNESFKKHPFFYDGDGVKVSQLVIRSLPIEEDDPRRPSMAQVARTLQSLSVFAGNCETKRKCESEMSNMLTKVQSIDKTEYHMNFVQ